MKFTVVWTPAAEAALSDLWTSASDQLSVTSAADSMDRMLSSDPQTKGEERDDDVRILIVPPLAIYFFVSVDDRLATVYAVWRWNY